jgi:hypothetical protein
MSGRKVVTARCGLSILEFVGCLAAVGGGIVVGSMYFGINLKEAAIGVLQYAEVAPPAQPSSLVAVVVDANSPTQLKVGVPPTGGVSVAASPTPSGVQGAISLTAEQREQLTRDYWRELNNIVDAEAQSRATEPEGGLLLHNYLAHRHAGHREAADALAALNQHSVDGHVAAYAIRVQTWHEEGAAMFAHAKNLVTDAPSAQLSGPFAREWQSSSTQHQMEERLLSDKRAAVQSYLDHAERAPAE